MTKIINPEKVAYWFFRINGCLTIENFVLHPERHEEGSSQITDADLLAVRFPYGAELGLFSDHMEDHKAFESNEKINLIIAEITREPCKLNGPWTKREVRPCNGFYLPWESFRKIKSMLSQIVFILQPIILLPEFNFYFLQLGKKKPLTFFEN